MFDEAAEFLFAGVMAGAVAGGEVFEGFVFYFEAFEVDDLKVFVALIPDLALQQFHDGLDKFFSRFQRMTGEKFLGGQAASAFALEAGDAQ